MNNGGYEDIIFGNIGVNQLLFNDGGSFSEENMVELQGGDL